MKKFKCDLCDGECELTIFIDDLEGQLPYRCPSFKLEARFTEVMTDADKLIWEQKYILRMVEKGLTKEMAKADFDASDEIDYNEDPILSADEALSYYGDGA